MDSEAYRRAVDEFGDMVYRIALNQTRSVPDAEDVTQAVFLKLYEKPPRDSGGAAGDDCGGSSNGCSSGGTNGGSNSGHGGGSSNNGSRVGGSGRSSRSGNRLAEGERLKAWLIRVTANECRSLWRTLWRRRVELREIRDDEAPPFEEPAFAEPAHEALYAALGELPEKCRIVVHLFYFEGMGTREIADTLGIKEPTVRTRLVRARKQLRESLKEAWDDEQCQPVQSHDGRGPCLC